MAIASSRVASQARRGFLPERRAVLEQLFSLAEGLSASAADLLGELF